MSRDRRSRRRTSDLPFLHRGQISAEPIARRSAHPIPRAANKCCRAVVCEACGVRGMRYRARLFSTGLPSDDAGASIRVPVGRDPRTPHRDPRTDGRVDACPPPCMGFDRFALMRCRRARCLRPSTVASQGSSRPGFADLSPPRLHQREANDHIACFGARHPGINKRRRLTVEAPTPTVG
jgi:hypothetical protein